MEKRHKNNDEMVTTPDIFVYLDYRSYLRDLCAAKKSKNPHFSYRYISQKVNIKSAGFFSWVLQGKRNISERLVLELARFFKFDVNETVYFENLVAFNQASTHEERRHAFDKVLSMRRGSVKQLESDKCAFYRTWYYPALRELISIIPVTDDTILEAALLLIPSVKPSDIREALLVLIRLDLVKKNESGRYEVTDKVISSRDYVPLIALYDYQMSCIDLAKAAFDRFEKSEREMSTVTMSVDDQAYLAILERLGSFRREMMEIARSVKKPSRVMQLNMQFFPLTMEGKAGSNG